MKFLRAISIFFVSLAMTACAGKPYIVYHKPQPLMISTTCPIAVLEFAPPDYSSEQIAGKVISNYFEMLIPTTKCSVVNRMNIRDIINEQQFQLSGLTDDSTAIRIGRMVGARSVLIGQVISYKKRGVLFSKTHTVTFQCKLLSVETGNILFSTTSQYEDVAEVLPSLEQMAGYLVEATIAKMGEVPE
ncbi:MAG: hypothetical protein NTW12_04710 [Deltaproteobacteria bacterium]|nr:hypothetical protein [Deltaproteobacteria bacterium]